LGIGCGVNGDCGDIGGKDQACVEGRRGARPKNLANIIKARSYRRALSALTHMNILLAFAPFIVFALADRVAGAVPGLVSGALVSLVLLIHDALSRERKIKILELGTMILFGGLALYSLLVKVEWSIIGVRLCVDAGLLLVVLVSMAVRQPFTLQYAREKVSPEHWSSPDFIRVNYIVTAVWGAAFAVMVVADLVMLYVPAVPLRVGVWTTIIAIFGAFRFTSWYPDWNRKSKAA
jgi:hypothetical protein